MTRSQSEHKTDTLAAHAGLSPFAHHGIVNPPVYHASTILFPTLAALEAADSRPFEIYNYGRIGTPTTAALEDAVAVLEGGHRAVVTGSGLSAITLSLCAFLHAGDHALIADTVYGPTRRFCLETLALFGVEIEFYDPALGAGIAARLKPNTRVVFVESPGSLTFEVQDVPAIAAAAHSVGAKVLMDNTWATPLYFKPFTHGVDVSIHAATKYIVGHSDANLGLVVCSAETFDPIKRTAVRFGITAGPDDIFLGLRGLRTLPVRLKRHGETAIELAVWLRRRPEVARVLHPALPEDPGHAVWRRDFTGACGLFAIELKPCRKAALAAMLDGMSVFGMGYSWGGFESLILPVQPAKVRSATRWEGAGPLVRLHAGLEDPADLIADLERGFARLAAAAAG